MPVNLYARARKLSENYCDLFERSLRLRAKPRFASIEEHIAFQTYCHALRTLFESQLFASLFKLLTLPIQLIFLPLKLQFLLFKFSLFRGVLRRSNCQQSRGKNRSNITGYSGRGSARLQRRLATLLRFADQTSLRDDPAVELGASEYRFVNLTIGILSHHRP